MEELTQEEAKAAMGHSNFAVEQLLAQQVPPQELENSEEGAVPPEQGGNPSNEIEDLKMKVEQVISEFQSLRQEIKDALNEEE